MKKTQRFGLLLLLALSSACASKPPVAEHVDEAKGTAGRRVGMEARVQLQNKTEKKTYSMVLEAVALEPSRMRLDLRGPFGAAMGKFVLRGDQVGILVPQQKKAYLGTASEEAFTPILPMKLNPRVLMSLLFGEIPEGWSCESKDGKEVCRDPGKKFVLERAPGPEAQQKKWSVSGDQFAMVLMPTSVTTNVQLKPETFSMPIPEGYSKHKLP